MPEHRQQIRAVETAAPGLQQLLVFFCDLARPPEVRSVGRVGRSGDPFVGRFDQRVLDVPGILARLTSTPLWPGSTERPRKIGSKPTEVGTASMKLRHLSTMRKPRSTRMGFCNSGSGSPTFGLVLAKSKLGPGFEAKAGPDAAQVGPSSTKPWAPLWKEARFDLNRGKCQIGRISGQVLLPDRAVGRSCHRSVGRSVRAIKRSGSRAAKPDAPMGLELVRQYVSEAPQRPIPRWKTRGRPSVARRLSCDAQVSLGRRRRRTKLWGGSGRIEGRRPATAGGPTRAATEDLMVPIRVI